MKCRLTQTKHKVYNTSQYMLEERRFFLWWLVTFIYATDIDDAQVQANIFLGLPVNRKVWTV